MVWSIRWGADTVMDLSTGRNIHTIREWIIRNSPVPIGTVPIYQALEKVGGKAEELTWEIYRDTLIEQCEQGVDYFTIHAGVRLPLHPADREPRHRHRLARRLDHGQMVPGASQGELPLHALRARSARSCARYDVSVLARRRPAPGLDRRRQRRGAVRRAGDPGRAHQDRAGTHDVQVMIEGPGHVPMHKIKDNMDKQLAVCGEAPFYTLGPLDDRHRARLRPHHLRHRRGDDRLVRHRDALLRDAEGASRACPTATTSRIGVITYKIAAHAADLAKGHPGARSCATTRSRRARFEFRWRDQFNLVARPRDGGEVPRPDAAGRRRQARAFLLDVRTEILLDEDHPGDPRARRKQGMDEMSEKFLKKGAEIYHSAADD